MLRAGFEGQRSVVVEDVQPARLDEASTNHVLRRMLVAMFAFKSVLANQNYSIANPIALTSREVDVELTGLIDFRSDPSSKARNARK